MNNSALKKAFIAAQLDFSVNGTHKFSPEFEKRMKKLMRMQSGAYKLINTAGKRAACIVLAAVFAFTAVACGVKEVREPIVKEIRRIFVNARELFTNTPAENISSLIPSEIEKIVAADRTSESGAKYTVEDPEKIKSFIGIMADTAWYSPEDETNNTELKPYWSFEFYGADGKCLSRLDMCRDIFSSGDAVIVNSVGERHTFRISVRVYSELLCFTNKKYYLHNSNLPLPSAEFCTAAEERITAGLNKDEKKRAEREIRDAHYAVEKFLLENVSNLKSWDSIYWRYLESGESFIDPIANYERKFDTDKTVRTSLSYIISTVTDKSGAAELKKALKIWERGVKEHSIEDLFIAHEYIHDYDYFAINYPTQYVYDNFADYQGIDDYFGRVSE